MTNKRHPIGSKETATKGDLEDLREDLQVDMHHMEERLIENIQGVKEELTENIQSVREELLEKIKSTAQETVKEIKYYFDAVVEHMKLDVGGAYHDELVNVKDHQEDHEERIKALERKR